ncbi:ubiquitin-protein ligase E3B-like [Tubulanus polymorphus]|uniref:ubiquitin-protein ligase E3B-like n=1 Tax=Tubulanus polymorphus TaxID=672921 RepID=UPI003DA260E0
MFSKVDKKSEFLNQAKVARAERAHEKQRDDGALVIQRFARGYLTRKHVRASVIYELDEFMQTLDNQENDYKPVLKPAIAVHKTIRKFMFVLDQEADNVRFEYLCKYILISVEAENKKNNYLSVTLSKSDVLFWIQQVKSILWQCCVYLKSLKPESPKDMKVITTYLHMLVNFTSTSNWKILKGKSGEALRPGMNQLCSNVMRTLNAKGMYPAIQQLLMHGLARSKPSFKHATLSAILTIALRPLIASNFSDNLMTVFLLHILSVPGIIYHVSITAQECLALLMTHRIFKKTIDLLANEQRTKIVFNSLEGNYALCLLANVIQLGSVEIEGLVEKTQSFVDVVISLLESCEQYVQNKKSNLTHWHPVLGWFSQKTDQSLHEAMPFVVKQLQLLWSMKMIKILFSDLMATIESQKVEAAQTAAARMNSPSKNILKRAMDKASSNNKPVAPRFRADSPVVVNTCNTCTLYHTALNTLTQLRTEILAGLSCQDVLLPVLWKFFDMLGPTCGLKSFIDVLVVDQKNLSHPLYNTLILFADTAAHLVIILDDIELYEQNKPFNLDDLVQLSTFLNQLLFKLVWNNLLDVRSLNQNSFFSTVHSLLMILYDRDCRRSYTPKDHWLIKDVKPSVILTELERKRRTAQFLMQKMPFIIPHKERVILFRKYVAKEKEVMGITESACASPQSTLIMIHRNRLIEDGYRQLAQLPTRSLKGVIRVKFINEQGLDEAGIDQDGVFKEFLEETIARVFDPSLNLFKVTSEQKLYPSTTSHIQENHLALFEFVGRMLGKAVYEGIVVDVPFASFFLSHILGHQHNSTYSSIDELPSLDPDLYKSLSYIKHYDGDLADLDLTFSYDEDVMGKIVTHELVPGRKGVSVTNENKISYVHLMAHFRMYKQIKEQTQAFIRGFKGIINPDWLSMFSTPELQMLISGEATDVDLEDLRKYTQYYGGFHNNHKVINWLWDILEKQFTAQERSLFLKFVTSCSKPPLLGFAHLEPPFSIRCVEVSDDQDTGDTVGSVLKGFFNIRKKDPIGRLPTSSTCFNLLKLPNYQKKVTLRDKLRYAITSNTGFELS